MPTSGRWRTCSRQPATRPAASASGTTARSGRSTRWPAASTPSTASRRGTGGTISTPRSSVTDGSSRARAISPTTSPTGRSASSNAMRPDRSFASWPSTRPTRRWACPTPTGTGFATGRFRSAPRTPTARISPSRGQPSRWSRTSTATSAGCSPRSTARGWRGTRSWSISPTTGPTANAGAAG